MGVFWNLINRPKVWSSGNGPLGLSVFSQKHVFEHDFRFSSRGVQGAFNSNRGWFLSIILAKIVKLNNIIH